MMGPGELVGNFDDIFDFGFRRRTQPNSLLNNSIVQPIRYNQPDNN